MGSQFLNPPSPRVKHLNYSSNTMTLSQGSKLCTWVAIKQRWQSKFGEIPEVFRDFPAQPWILAYRGPICQQIYICKANNPESPPEVQWYKYQLRSGAAPTLEPGIAVQSDTATKKVTVVDNRSARDPIRVFEF